MEITLHRDWFSNNEIENEFDYVLRELKLGLNDEDTNPITEVKIQVDKAEVVELDFSPVDSDNHKQP